MQVIDKNKLTLPPCIGFPSCAEMQGIIEKRPPGGRRLVICALVVQPVVTSSVSSFSAAGNSGNDSTAAYVSFKKKCV